MTAGPATHSTRFGAARRWARIVPLIFITYSLAYLDRANFGLAAAAGMPRDLHLTPGMLSAMSSFFSLGYFLFQMPGAMYAERRSVKKLVFVSLILWGACATLTGVVSNVRALLAIRFALGVIEAAVFPALLIYVSRWFVRAERSRANTLLILGNPLTVVWMSVISGYLIQIFSWRWMFILEGVPSVLWAAVWWIAIRERPGDAAWLSPEEKAGLEAKFAEEQSGVRKIANYRAALRSPTVILLSLQFFFWTLGVFGFVLWLPTILKEGRTMGMVETGWLSSVPYLVAVVAMTAVSAFSDRSLRRQRYIWPALALSAIALFSSCLLGPAHFWASFALLVVAGAAMYAPYGPFWALIPELLPQNVAGGAMALINSVGAFGAFVGAFGVGYLNGVTGGPGASITLMAAAVAISSALIAFVR